MVTSIAPAFNASPQARLNHIARRLQDRVARYEAEKDCRCVFTYTYSLITASLADALPRMNFRDPQWVVGLAEAFADRYLTALDFWDTNQSAPGAWGAVFAAIAHDRTSVLEELVLSMAAHLIEDLPHALVSVGLQNKSGGSCISDFHLMNEVLGNAIGPIQNGVSKRYSPYLHWLDRLGRRHDEMLTNYGMRLCRGMAWYNANRLLDPVSQQKTEEAITNSVIKLLDEALNPPLFSMRVLQRFARFLAGRLRIWPKAPSAVATANTPTLS
jgi:hypothetical protein